MNASFQPIKFSGSSASGLAQLNKRGTKALVDNRPRVVAQRKLQQVADASRDKRHLPMQLQEMRPLHQGVIQRTTWVLKESGWKKKSSSPTDTNRWPAPNKHFPIGDLGDEYDQNTGQITSGTEENHVLDSIIKPGDDFGGVYKGRANTAYGVFNKNTCLQGPHTLAHIAKRTALEVRSAFEPGFNLYTLGARTSLLPSPGQSRALVKKYEKKAGVAFDRKLKKVHNSIYQDKLERKDNSDVEDDDRNTATVEALELCILATYSLEKEAIKAELKHKNENRETAKDDLVRTVNRKKKKKLPKNLTTFDIPKRGVSTKHYNRYVLDFAAVAVGKPIKESDIDSESEYSELDSEEEALKKKLEKRRAVNKKVYNSDDSESSDSEDFDFGKKQSTKRKRTTSSSASDEDGGKRKKRKTK